MTRKGSSCHSKDVIGRQDLPSYETVNALWLFAEYINTFLKIKTDASGWPEVVQSEVEKEQFIQDFETHEGIQLDKEKMEENLGSRPLAKLCLNYLWERLGMKENKGKMEKVHNTERYFELMISGKLNVNSLDCFSEYVFAVQYKMEDDFMELNASTNVVIVAFTTCWARSHLTQFMEKLGTQLLYCDTDVVSSHNLSPLGNYLVDLNSELSSDGWIEEFVSIGRKCYSYRTNKGKFCTKVEGHIIIKEHPES